MSQEIVKKFVEQANQDKKIQDSIKSYTGIPEETYRKITKLAKENGFIFSEDDWKNYPKCKEPGKSAHGFESWSSEILVPWLK